MWKLKYTFNNTAFLTIFLIHQIDTQEIHFVFTFLHQKIKYISCVRRKKIKKFDRMFYFKGDDSDLLFA